MKDFGLADIEGLRKQMTCREGLLIDYDYAAVLADSEGESEGEEDEELGEESKAFDPHHKLSGGRTVSLYFDM